jgi:hypothetical protein
MNRFQAGAAHLGISAAVAGAIFLPIYFVWYPDVLFQSAGGRELFLLVAGVDVTLGPLITTLVYRRGKRGMKFDLAVIAILQVAALAYGVSVLYESRPAYIVFVKDRFDLVRANTIAQDSLGKARVEDRERVPFTGPRVVGARLPEDADERFKLALSGMGGTDVQAYPEYHVPYEQVRLEAAAAGRPLAALRELNPEKSAEIDRMVAALGREEGRLRFLPTRAGKIDLTAIVDGESGELLRLAALRPWQY